MWANEASHCLRKNCSSQKRQHLQQQQHDQQGLRRHRHLQRQEQSQLLEQHWPDPEGPKQNEVQVVAEGSPTSTVHEEPQKTEEEERRREQ
jgi:hypothetical protein